MTGATVKVTLVEKHERAKDWKKGSCFFGKYQTFFARTIEPLRGTKTSALIRKLLFKTTNLQLYSNLIMWQIWGRESFLLKINDLIWRSLLTEIREMKGNAFGCQSESKQKSSTWKVAPLSPTYLLAHMGPTILLQPLDLICQEKKWVQKLTSTFGCWNLHLSASSVSFRSTKV